MTTKAQQVIEEVLKLDGVATPAPWRHDSGNRTIEYDSHKDAVKVYPSGHKEKITFRDEVFSFQDCEVNDPDSSWKTRPEYDEDADLVEHYRTSAPKLAKALAVALEHIENTLVDTIDGNNAMAAKEALSQINQIFGADDEKA